MDNHRWLFDTARSKKILMLDPLPAKTYKVEGKYIKSAIDFPAARKFYNGSPVSLRDPISLEYIAAYIEKYGGFESEILIKFTHSIPEMLEMVAQQKDNILAVMVSLHSTFLLPQALELCRGVKKIKDLPVIVGGYHPTGDPSIVLEDSVDFAVIGEGEETALQLLQALYDRKPVEDTLGIAYQKNAKEFVVNPRRKRLDFADIPFPKRSLEILKHCDPGPFSKPAFGNVAQICHTRGCQYGCEFCASPNMWKQKVTYRDPARVAEEMKDLVLNYDVNLFFFCDLSFNANLAETKELCRHIKKLQDEVDKPFYWRGMCTLTNIDEELIAMMKAAGCTKVDYGIESLDPESRRRIKPPMSLEEMRRRIKMTSDYGILTRALLMVGYPWENKERLQRAEDNLQTLAIDHVRTTFYTPFPGAELWKRYKDKLIVNYEGLTSDLPAIECEGISTEELLKKVKQMSVSYYNSEHYRAHLENKLTKFPEFTETFEIFLAYLLEKNIITLDSPCIKVLKGLKTTVL